MGRGRRYRNWLRKDGQNTSHWLTVDKLPSPSVGIVQTWIINQMCVMHIAGSTLSWPCKITFAAGLIWVFACYHMAEVMDLSSVSWEYQLSRPPFNLSLCHHSIIYQGLYSLNEQTSYHHILKLDLNFFLSFWHLTGRLGSSAAETPVIHQGDWNIPNLYRAASRHCVKCFIAWRIQVMLYSPA